MNRRDIFKALGMGSFMGISTKPSGKCLTSDHNYFEHCGWGSIWTKWTAWGQSDGFVAQWLAYWKEGYNPFSLYVSNPGDWGWFVRGQMFDVSWMMDQKWVSHRTSNRERDIIQEEMREAMVKLIDHAENSNWRGSVESMDKWRLPAIYPEFSKVRSERRWNLVNPRMYEVWKVESER